MSRRLSVVDLTSAHPISDRRSSTSLPRVQQPAVNRARSEATPRGIKRRRGDDGFWSPDPSGSSQEREQEEEEYVESVDLTEPEISLSKALAKQREDAIKAQQSTEEEKSGSVLSAYKCPVCLETPKDATSTACGHLFCHLCIVECLNSTEQRGDPSKQIRGTCPVCRKGITKVDRSGPRRSLIPLQLKLTTKKRSFIPPAQA
ncbi:hypothetical protein PENDEC_c009G04989 [Penicillium decumbens]|uniref:RING-type domain-containing protein n=1 Tax=Penicillium decumbens TaxID=69771 RepID=A0A1V6PCY1_PENDC|nr:hypothetical protein PENDEC_c009G04989 [Penicillium decumbens]